VNDLAPPVLLQHLISYNWAVSITSNSCLPVSILKIIAAFPNN